MTKVLTPVMPTPLIVSSDNDDSGNFPEFSLTYGSMGATHALLGVRARLCGRANQTSQCVSPCTAKSQRYCCTSKKRGGLLRGMFPRIPPVCSEFWLSCQNEMQRNTTLTSV